MTKNCKAGPETEDCTPPQSHPPSTSLCLQAIALALGAGAKLALLALEDEPVHALATLATFVMTPPEKPVAVLTRVVLHDMVPLLLHNLLLSNRRLLVEPWLLGGCLCSLAGKHALVEQGAPTISWLSLRFPGCTTYVAEVSSASAGCDGAVSIVCLET